MAIIDEVQQNEHYESPRQFEGPETTETLNSILTAVEGLNTKIAAMAKQQKKLVVHMRVMDEELTNRIAAPTSPHSGDVSAGIANVKNRLKEIENMLSEFVHLLDGKRLSAATRSLAAEAQKNRADTASAVERLKAQAAANQELMSQISGAVQRIEKRTQARVDQAVEHVAGKASATLTANLDAANERSEKILAATSKVEARQLWSAVAAMCIALLPVFVVVAGFWMSIAGLITGAQWALDVDGNVWLGIGRWFIVAGGIAAAFYGLVASVRRVAGLMEIWKRRGLLQ